MLQVRLDEQGLDRCCAAAAAGARGGVGEDGLAGPGAFPGSLPDVPVGLYETVADNHGSFATGPLDHPGRASVTHQYVMKLILRINLTIGMVPAESECTRPTGIRGPASRRRVRAPIVLRSKSLVPFEPPRPEP